MFNTSELQLRLFFYECIIILVILLLLATRYIVIKLQRYYKGLPVNGPVGLPFVGCMWNRLQWFYLGNPSVLIRYGQKCDVFTARCGTTDIVIFNDIDLIRKIGKENKHTLDTIMQNWSGLHWGDTQSFMFSNKNWRERRKLVHRTLIAQHQSQYIDKMFNKYFNKLIIPKLQNHINNNTEWNTLQNDLAEALFLITAQLTFTTDDIDINEKLKYDKIRSSALQIIDIYGDAFDYAHLFEPFSFVSKWLYGVKLSHNNNNKGLFKIWNNHIKPLLNEKLVSAKQTYNNKNKTETYFDFAINAQLNGFGKNKYKPRDDEIISDAYGIIEGKVTSSALRCSWGIYLFALFPEIYQQIKQELLNIFPNKVFSFHKIRECVLLQSFVHEVVRTGSFYRLSFGRMVINKGIHFKNGDNKKYHLPPSTIIKINKCYVDYSNRYFKYPKTIYLNHHIDEISGKFRVHSYFTSFGTGNRNCVGRSVATKEMAILFATLILLNYKFELTVNDKHKQLLNLNSLDRKLSAFTYSDAKNAAVIVKQF